VLFASLTIVACKTPVPQTTDIAIFVDFTEAEEHDGRILLGHDGELDQILDEIATPDMRDPRFLNGGSIVLYPINSHGLLRAGHRVALPTGHPYDSKMIRKKRVSDFYDDVRTAYHSFVQVEQETGGEIDEMYSTTYIVQPVCQYLATIPAVPEPHQRRYVLIYSDLLEHSSVFSFYPSISESNGETDNQQNVANTLLSACGAVQALLQMSYQLIPQPLPKSMDGHTQLYAQQVWSLVFKKLGLHEDRLFAS
jgi:hypothetical protein